jgi:hypothetical protein
MIEGNERRQTYVGLLRVTTGEGVMHTDDLAGEAPDRRESPTPSLRSIPR